MKLFESLPCFENARELVQDIEKEKFEIICGVGGGVVGDMAKLTAEFTEVHLMQIPTSAATCVPTSALSIMYDRETRVFQGSYICKKEADAVIVDTQIMINQPPRLFWAGLIDSKAKMIEIHHYFRTGRNIPLGLESAWALSKEIDRFYDENMEKIEYAITNKEITQEFETALFNMIAVTGIISGLSKNSSQTAIGHAVYYAVRTKFCNEARAFLHGEIVGIGLIAQLAFNDGDFISMRDLLKKMNLPTSLSDIKILPSEENKHFFVDKLCENKDIVSPQEKHKVDFAISKIL